MTYLFCLLPVHSYGNENEKMRNNDNTYLWHTRLGHLNMDKLKTMIKINLVNDFPNLSSFGRGEVC